MCVFECVFTWLLKKGMKDTPECAEVLQRYSRWLNKLKSCESQLALNTTNWLDPQIQKHVNHYWARAQQRMPTLSCSWSDSDGWFGGVWFVWYITDITNVTSLAVAQEVGRATFYYGNRKLCDLLVGSNLNAKVSLGKMNLNLMMHSLR